MGNHVLKGVTGLKGVTAFYGIYNAREEGLNVVELLLEIMLAGIAFDSVSKQGEHTDAP